MGLFVQMLGSVILLEIGHLDPFITLYRAMVSDLGASKSFVIHSNQFTEKGNVYVLMWLLLSFKQGRNQLLHLGLKQEGVQQHSMEDNRLFEILDRVVLRKVGGKKSGPTMKEAAVEMEGIQMQKEDSVLQLVNKSRLLL